MSEGNQHELAGNKICSIISCSECNAYHLSYRYLRLSLSYENLNSILQALYVYETKIASSDLNLPFKVTFGIIELTVYHTDYKQFKDVIETAVLHETELPESILQMDCGIEENRSNKHLIKKK